MTERHPSDYWRWAHHLANRLRPFDDPIHDDLVQEALFAIWQAMREKPDATASYYAEVGRHAMTAILRGRAHTGSGGGQHYRPTTLGLDDDGWARVDRGSDPWPGIDDHLVVRDALAHLEPDDAVLVWEWATGTPTTELSRQRGYGRTYAHNRINRDVLPAMRGYLKEVM